MATTKQRQYVTSAWVGLPAGAVRDAFRELTTKVDAIAGVHGASRSEYLNLDSLSPGAGISISTLANGDLEIKNIGVRKAIAGTGISLNSQTGDITITNSGVTQLTAGAGIGLNAQTGNVTVTNNGVTSIVAGAGISVNQGTGAVTVTSTALTSVGLSMPGQFAVANTPLTANGTLAVTWNDQTANQVLAGPASGGASAPTFRGLVASDIPALAYVTSVALTAPGFLSVAGSPVTSNGTLALSLATQAPKKVFIGPASGADAAPTFRLLETTDLPAGVMGQDQSNQRIAGLRYECLVGDGINSSYTIAHKLGCWVAVEVYEVSTGDLVRIDVTRIDADNVKADFGNVIANNSYRIVCLAVSGADYTATFGDASNTTYDIEHILGEDTLIAQVFDAITGEKQECDIKAIDENTTRVTVNSAPGANALRIVLVNRPQDRFTKQVGNGSSTTITVNHAKNKRWGIVQTFNVSTGLQEDCSITLTDANSFDLTFVSAPASNSIRVIFLPVA
jgi:hypothetical protein